MITKVMKSSDLGATLRYVYQEFKDPEYVDGTVLSPDREGAHRELGAFIAERPEIKQPVFHAVLSVPEGEPLEREAWQEIARQYTQEMGFEQCAYVAVKHHDTEHHHIHIVASRIDARGKLVSDSHDWNRSEQIARKLEVKHDLQRVAPSWEVDLRRSRQAEYHMHTPEQLTTRERMQHAVQQGLDASRDIESYQRTLQAHGVTLVPKLTEDQRVNGAWYELDGERIAASKVMRSASWNRVEARFDYDHKRDFKHIAPTPEAPSPTRSPEPTPTPAAPHTVTTPAHQAKAPQIQHTEGGARVQDHTPKPARAREPAQTPELRERRREQGLVRERRIERTPERAPETQRVSKASRVIERAPERHTPDELDARQRGATRAPDVGKETREPDTPKVSREQALVQVRAAMRRAPYHQGWEAWSSKLQERGVEPVPVGTQSDSTKFRAMTFTHEGHRFKGSEIERQASWKRLEGRLGKFEIERDHAAFSRVEIPGRGVESLQAPRPDHTQQPTPRPVPQPGHQAAPQRLGQTTSRGVEHEAPEREIEAARPVPVARPEPSKLDVLVTQLEYAGWNVSREPNHASGHLVREVRLDTNQRAWLVRTHEANTLAIVTRDANTRVIEARQDQDRLVALRERPAHEPVAENTPVRVQHAEGQRVLVAITQREPVREVEPRTERDEAPREHKEPDVAEKTERLARRFEQDGWQVQRDPEHVRGRVSHVLDANAHDKLVVVRVEGQPRTLAIVPVKAHDPQILARQATPARLEAPRALGAQERVAPGQDVEMRRSHEQRVVAVIDKSSPTLERHQEPRSALPEPPEDVKPLARDRRIVGTLEEGVYEKDGEKYRVIEARNGERRLVADDPAYKGREGQRFQAHHNPRGTWRVKDLELSKQRARDDR